MNGNNILVIGDAMLDIHLYGEVSRISPEAPVPVVLEQSRTTKLGGAGYVAAQIATASMGCFFAYKSFKEPRGRHTHLLLEQTCDELGILTRQLRTNKVHTVTTKERVWTGQQQICRIDTENTDLPSSVEEQNWIAEISEVIHKFPISCVVFSDYNKGTLTNNIIQTIVDLCNNHNIPTVLDPKRHDFINLSGLTVIKPNSREIMNTHMDAMHCSKKLKNTYLLNTLGQHGMRLYQNGEHLKHIPAILSGREVVDVCGAGDVTNATLGICLSNGIDIATAMEVANRAASVAIQHNGCYVLTRKEIMSILTKEEEA